MQKINFYFFVLAIISIIFKYNDLFVNSQINDVKSSLDLGCFSYIVEPPSGTIILNPNSFELMVEFNQNPIYIFDGVSYSKTTSVSDIELLSFFKYQDVTGLPIFNFWDKITNKTYLPNSSKTKGVGNRIWLTFINLPISNSLYFQSNIGLSSENRYLIGARSINVYSSNSVAPPKLEVNPFLSSCPISKRVEPIWNFKNPSSTQIYPSTLKVELCSTISDSIKSSSKICSGSNQKFYYSLVLPVSVGKGIVSTVLNSVTYQGFQYKFKDYQIKIQTNQDISVSIPLDYIKSYSPPYEVQLTSDPQNAPYQDLNVIDFKTLDNYISLYNSGYYNQVLYGDENVLKIFNMNSSIDSKFLIENYKSNFIFKSTTNNLIKEIYILIGENANEFYKDYFQCPQNSLRNSFTVNHGKPTIHSLGFLNPYKGFNFKLENLKINRDLQINFGHNINDDDESIKIKMNNNNSKSDYYLTKDLLVGVFVDFTVSSNQYQSLANSILFVPDSKDLNGNGLIIPKSSVGNGMNQIGLNVADWYKQQAVGFCNQEHGSNVKNQIQHYIQDGGYTLDLMIPNWINVGGQSIEGNGGGGDRTIINSTSSELLMKFNSNQALFKVYFSEFEFFEPMIHSDNLTWVGIAGTTIGKECFGQFQFDIINFGKESSIVNFDIDCIQDVYLEIVNFAQIIPGDSNQKRSFFVNVGIEKFYKSKMIQCNVSMWIDIKNRPIWSSINKSIKKMVEIPIFNGCNIPDPCLNINSEPIISKDLQPIIKYSGWNNLGNFLNSITIEIEIKNIGNNTGDFISTLDCQSNIQPPANVNIFMINDENFIITKGLEKSKTSIVQFLLYGESSPIDGIQLTCKIKTKLYKPNTICWLNYDQENLVSFNLLYPYDKCVQIYNTGKEPLIEYSLFEYSNGNAIPNYSFGVSQWFPSMDSNPLPKKHPLKVLENSLNKNSIRFGPVDTLYNQFPSIVIKNGGGKSGDFTIDIGNCSDSVFVWADSYTITIPSGEIRKFIFQVFSYPTNIKSYSVECQLSIKTDHQECQSDLGKSFLQNPFLVYPHYLPCAGNWLEPSLFKPLSFWDSNLLLNNTLEFSDLNFKIGKWNYYKGENTIIEPNYYYQDLSLQVKNVEYGYGNVISTLTCNDVGFTTTVLYDSKKSSCFISENSSCFIGWRISSLPTTPDQKLLDIIDCNLLIEIKDSEEPIQSCWTNSGKSIKSSFKLFKFIDPCITNTFDEVFLTTTTNNQIEYIYSSDWGLKTIINEYFDYFLYGMNNSTSNNLIYYSFKNIMIKNNGNGNGLVKSLVQINNPSVILILNESIIECEIQSNSYCTFTFLFGFLPNKFSSSFSSSSLLNFNDLEIKIQFLVLPKLCWSTINKTIEILIVSKLPTLPCGWDPLLSTNLSTPIYTTPPQVSLIYPNQYIIGNLNYYQNSNNVLNLKFSNWYKLTTDTLENYNFSFNENSLNQHQFYSINLTGYIYNMGDAGGVVIFRLACDNGNGTIKQFISIENDEIVSYIPAGRYYNFKFKIIVSDKSPYPSNLKSIKDNEMIMCKVSSIVNLEKCWNPYGKSVIQYIQLPFDSKYLNNQTTIYSNEKNDKILLISTLVPISFILFLILLYLILKYYKYLLFKFNEFLITSHQNKLIKPPSIKKEEEKVTNNQQQENIKDQVTVVTDDEKCGCGENLKYHCNKCPSSISNYCESLQCKNLIHSATLGNITHKHEPNIIVYRDPRDTWINNFKFKPNDEIVEDLILNKLNKFN
ncbi:hypothetical protein ACTFIT_011659 [Dictyostelium discoideum]